jgi:hypothetical protein
LHAVTTVFLFSTFSTIVAYAPLATSGMIKNGAVLLFWLLMAPVLPLILLSVAPAKAISRRLIFLAIGLLPAVEVGSMYPVCNDPEHDKDRS